MSPPKTVGLQEPSVYSSTGSLHNYWKALNAGFPHWASLYTLGSVSPASLVSIYQEEWSCPPLRIFTHMPPPEFLRPLESYLEGSEMLQLCLTKVESTELSTLLFQVPDLYHFALWIVTLHYRFQNTCSQQKLLKPCDPMCLLSTLCGASGTEELNYFNLYNLSWKPDTQLSYWKNF